MHSEDWEVAREEEENEDIDFGWDEKKSRKVKWRSNKRFKQYSGGFPGVKFLNKRTWSYALEGSGNDVVDLDSDDGDFFTTPEISYGIGREKKKRKKKGNRVPNAEKHKGQIGEEDNNESVEVLSVADLEREFFKSFRTQRKKENRSEQQSKNQSFKSSLNSKKWHCEVCDVTTNGFQCFVTHLTGKKHFKKQCLQYFGGSINALEDLILQNDDMSKEVKMLTEIRKQLEAEKYHQKMQMDTMAKEMKMILSVKRKQLEAEKSQQKKHKTQISTLKRQLLHSTNMNHRKDDVIRSLRRSARKKSKSLQKTSRQIQAMEKENSKLKDGSMLSELLDKVTCNICYDNQIDVHLDPCGHNMCKGCSEMIKGECPYCRQKIAKKSKMFL